MSSRPTASFATGAFIALALAALCSGAGYLLGAVSLPVAVAAGLAGFVVAIVVLAFVSPRPRGKPTRRKPAPADRGGDGGDGSTLAVTATAGTGSRGSAKGRDDDSDAGDGGDGGGGD